MGVPPAEWVERQRSVLPEAPAQTGGSVSEETRRERIMNEDIFQGKWKEMRGQVKEWWGKLTDDDLERVGGKADQFIGLLQQKYGYTRQRAEKEINRRLEEAKIQ
jgi:uncharacterized protein YjbJ (UPF0337 family)